MLRQQGTSSPQVCLTEKRLRQTDKSSPSLTASDCFFSHLYYLLKSSIPFPMWWGWYRQVVPLACQLVKNKIRVSSGTLILFPPHCLRHRCYLLMGYAPETPRQKDTPSTKGMVCLSVFTAIVPGNVADVYLDNWIDYHRLYPSCFYPHYKTIAKSLSLFMIRFLLFLYPASVKYHISHQNRLISL